MEKKKEEKKTSTGKIMQQKLKSGKKTTKKNKKKSKKKKQKQTETILSYLTQHKTQRNLGGVIFCRHMWKFRDAYIDLKKIKKVVYVKIICACVYASVEVTKGLFPSSFCALYLIDLVFLGLMGDATRDC